MQLVPNRFLFRVRYVCPYIAGIPVFDGTMFHLPETCRVESMADMDGKSDFADVRFAWNEAGLAVEVTVRGKERELECNAAKPRVSDGMSLWIDTRDSRTSHRASRFCHHFILLPTGDGEDRDEPYAVQVKINRASQDAPIAAPGEILFQVTRRASGYRIAAFFASEILTGFDPEQNPKIGVFYVIRDAELGEQSLGAAGEMPYAEDPTLWQVMELVR